jgi:sulfur carrier protein ThiS
MKVKVRLHGTLGQKFPGDRSSQRTEIEIPDGATVKDLLSYLEILETSGAAVITGGRVLKADEKMHDGSFLDVFQIIKGG